MLAKIDNILLKKIIILFWALGWLVAVWTDIIGGFAHMGIIQASWAPDVNFPFLVKSLQMYHLPMGMIMVFFIGIILCSLISTILFFYSCAAFHKEKKIWLQRAKVAFIFSLSYWMLFFLADQIIMNFDLEQNHMVQGGFELLTFFAMYILPD